MQRIELEEALMEEREEEEKKPHLMNLPSFGFAVAAAAPDPGPGITADELFSGGRILPSYPLFNLDLLPPAADPPPPPPSSAAAAARSGSLSSSSSSEAEDGGFCAWAPRSAPQSPERWAKKSASTGSSSSSPARRWRIRDLVVGRSSSDGKDKFLFLSSPRTPTHPPTHPQTLTLTLRRRGRRW
uniref:Uncharacterized protein n=1 Tax=Ananas comosus var. bracteatus TaxID=296719 RepID=A0A6V7QIS4_ANACO|nr:unnamed protein product [Ananas comosus var. bracteatus]